MKKLSTREFVLLALLIAILIVLAYVNIPQPAGLSITLCGRASELLKSIHLAAAGSKSFSNL